MRVKSFKDLKSRMACSIYRFEKMEPGLLTFRLLLGPGVLGLGHSCHGASAEIALASHGGANLQTVDGCPPLFDCQAAQAGRSDFFVGKKALEVASVTQFCLSLRCWSPLGLA